MTTSNANKPRIGFIGMGRMGSEMSERLLQAGYPLTVYDRTNEKTQEVAQHGAQVANTPKEVAERTDVVISMVSDNPATEAVMFEPDGVLAGVGQQSTLIDMSSISPELSRHISKAALAKGAKMIDAAVSGSTPQAKEGSLMIFVGGEQATFEQCQPILSVLGKNAFYMGGSGSGSSMKLVVNTLLGLGLQAVAEAVALGQKAGLDKKQLLDVLGQTTVIAPAHKLKLANVEKEQYETNFALAMMRKDFSLIMRLAAELSVSMPATAAAEQMYAAALAQGYNEDYSVMLQFMEKLSGIQE